MVELRRLHSDAEFVWTSLAGQVSREELPWSRDLFIECCGPKVYSCQLLVDLSQVNFLDSSGMHWLVVSNKRFHDEGGSLLLHSAPGIIRQFLELVRLDRVLALFENETAARQAARPAISA